MEYPINENLRYLLWSERVERPKWVSELAHRTGIEARRIAEVLEGEYEAITQEQQQIAEGMQIPEEELLYSNLVEQAEKAGEINILKLNVQYLLSSLEHGKQKQLAAHLGAGNVTVSRWANGQQLPQRKYLRELSRYFDLPPDTDLTRQPVFLYDLPKTDDQRRMWLHERIDKLEAETLREIFPALKRLLQEP